MITLMESLLFDGRGKTIDVIMLRQVSNIEQKRVVCA